MHTNNKSAPHVIMHHLKMNATCKCSPPVNACLSRMCITCKCALPNTPPRNAHHLHLQLNATCRCVPSGNTCLSRLHHLKMCVTCRQAPPGNACHLITCATWKWKPLTKARHLKMRASCKGVPPVRAASAQNRIPDVETEADAKIKAKGVRNRILNRDENRSSNVRNFPCQTLEISHNDTPCRRPAPAWLIGRPGSGCLQGVIGVF
jgi:hypothetical protein